MTAAEHLVASPLPPTQRVLETFAESGAVFVNADAVKHARFATEPLDGLRGVAILLVMIFHTWLFSWYTPYASVLGVDLHVDTLARTGYVGVVLFFALSGFVLFYPHARRAVAGTGTTHGPRDFALRRVAKIVPSYALAFAVTALSLWSLHKPFALGPAVLEHALFVNDFFEDPMGVANSVFWSLAVEAQFYVIFLPLAALFRKLPVVTTIGMVAIAVTYRHVAAEHYLLVEPVYRQFPAFLDVFAVGMFGAYTLAWFRANVRETARTRALWTLAAVASLIAIALLLASADAVQYVRGGPERWDAIYRTPLAAAFATLALASCAALPAWRAAVANPVARFFSLISYNLYLWHTLVMIWIWRKDVLPHAAREPHDDAVWKALFIATSWLAAIGVATVVTYFVERPILARISPQTFAFDWSRVVRAMRLRPSSASAETRS